MLSAVDLPLGARARQACRALVAHGVDPYLAAVAGTAMAGDADPAEVLRRIPEIPFTAYRAVCSTMEGGYIPIEDDVCPECDEPVRVVHRHWALHRAADGDACPMGGQPVGGRGAA